MLDFYVHRVIDRIGHALLSLRFRLLLPVLLACAPLVALTLHTASEGRRRAVAGWHEWAQRATRLARREEGQVSCRRPCLLGCQPSAPERASSSLLRSGR